MKSKSWKIVDAGNCKRYILYRYGRVFFRSRFVFMHYAGRPIAKHRNIHHLGSSTDDRFSQLRELTIPDHMRIHKEERDRFRIRPTLLGAKSKYDIYCQLCNSWGKASFKNRAKHYFNSYCTKCAYIYNRNRYKRDADQIEMVA